MVLLLIHRYSNLSTIIPKFVISYALLSRDILLTFIQEYMMILSPIRLCSDAFFISFLTFPGASPPLL
jgi:hypothetical protein